LKNRMKMVAVGLSAATAMICAPAHAATKITVAVAESFSKAAVNIVASFESYYLLNFGVTYNVGIVIESDAQIQSDIEAGGTTGPYDMYLASSVDSVAPLVVKDPSVISGTFLYAVDGLDLYSPTIDVTGGLPFPLTTNFVVPAPATDTYGQAAAEVLALGPWHISPTAIPGGFVSTEPSAGTTYSVLRKGLFPYGFVGRSQICSLQSGTQIYPPGSFHHEYTSSVAIPTPLYLTGLTLSRGGTTDQATEVSNLIAFLTGSADSNGNTTTLGTSIIQGYCLDLP
jgi:molybdate transport system substrate-binding protein